MSEINRTLRVRTAVGESSEPVVSVALEQDYDAFEILSLKLTDEDVYKLHNANYGVVVGRVLANGGFGVPNAKISVFIEGVFDDSVTDEITAAYPYTTVRSTDTDGVRYNLLPNEQVDDCHQTVGTFPNKTYTLDNDVLIEVFDKYYKYTTRTNNSGDYMICGVPTGNQTIHMDLDLSDCGILSQRPRDFVYKGYTIEQFENPNQFKADTDFNSLAQIFSQDKTVNVVPFWGNESLGETIGITRADIEIAFKFEPTCVFMGSIVGDNASNGISKKCVPTDNMGAMDELVAGEGTIEMIRKTAGGEIEEFQVKGNQVIDGNGVWCYQIPMNLDYVMTDEYGNLVATDDPSKGIPTRARVRFRVSMQDSESNTANYFRAKVLVPHNPNIDEDYDYEFGTYTRDESFRDLFWNNVYTVKSYIPRFQKSTRWKTERFTGIKHCNIYGANNPMPYNNIRIKLPFMFSLLCTLIIIYVKMVALMNRVILRAYTVGSRIFKALLIISFGGTKKWTQDFMNEGKYIVIKDGLCPDLDNWYFAPVKGNKEISYNFKKSRKKKANLLKNTYDGLVKDDLDGISDPNSIDTQNTGDTEERVCITTKTDFLISCIEMNLAQEYKVINFDFYNDWVNGVVYMPRWNRKYRKKRTFLFGLIKLNAKVKACMDKSKIFGNTRKYTQQCAISYTKDVNTKALTVVSTTNGCQKDSGISRKTYQKCHKGKGKKHFGIFGKNGGIVHENETIDLKYVYYFKPCEKKGEKKVNLFANDVVLLGTLNDCSEYGIPQAFKYLTSSSYIMPTNLALTNMDEAGYLYADETGTYCGQNKNYNDKALSQVPVSYSATSKYWGDNTDGIEPYGEYDDTVPITEAAGIAWNYTGPQQGKVNRSKLYQPGGHFLGLTCTKTETNIKSCINLQRICEAGADMSQRREEVRRVESANENGILYNYYVPTGLISNEDISGREVRSMFATLNQKRLLCTGGTYDERTGYPIYDFMYLRPDGFNGGLSQKIGEDYNCKLTKDEVGDESAVLTAVTVADSYDMAISANTYRRTLESTNTDYYLFRMGLESLDGQEKKFLNEAPYSLPQYENSFYFYFGIKEGSTALDEFNKQFFSTCANNSIVMSTPQLIVSFEEDDCELNTDALTVNIVNMEAPYKYELRDYSDKTVIATGENEYNSTITIEKTLTFGSYTLEVGDYNGLTAKKTFAVGNGTIETDDDVKAFDFRTDGLTVEEVPEKAMEHDSGYYSIWQWVSINGKQMKVKDKVGLIIASDDYYTTVLGDSITLEEDIKTDLGLDKKTGLEAVTKEEGGYIKIFLWEENVDYDLFILRVCDEDKKVHAASLKMIHVDGLNGADLYLQTKALPYSTVLSRLKPENNWWENIGQFKLLNEEIWAMKHALFRQTTDSAETFFDNVIALGPNDETLTTELWGQPEAVGTVWSGIDGVTVAYEADVNIFDGYELSDESVISTWPKTKRKFFGKMAISNGTPISEAVGKLSNITVVPAMGDASYNLIYANYSEITGREGYVIEGHGCIIKLTDGTLVYPIVTTIVGNQIVLRYTGDAFDSIEGTVYPLFIYPVMEKPFHVKAYFCDWKVNNPDNITESTYTNGYFHGWKGDIKVYNGIVYSDKGSAAVAGWLSHKSTINDIPQTNLRREVGKDTSIEEAVVSSSTHYDFDGMVGPHMDEYDTDIEEMSVYVEEGHPDEALLDTGGFETPSNSGIKDFASATISMDLTEFVDAIKFVYTGDTLNKKFDHFEFYIDDSRVEESDISTAVTYYYVPSNNGNLPWIPISGTGVQYNILDGGTDEVSIAFPVLEGGKTVVPYVLERYSDNDDEKDYMGLTNSGGTTALTSYKLSEVVTMTSSAKSSYAVTEYLKNLAKDRGLILLPTYQLKENAKDVSEIDGELDRLDYKINAKGQLMPQPPSMLEIDPEGGYAVGKLSYEENGNTIVNYRIYPFDVISSRKPDVN